MASWSSAAERNSSSLQRGKKRQWVSDIDPVAFFHTKKQCFSNGGMINLKRSILISLLCALCIAICVNHASATLIPITNYSFENPVFSDGGYTPIGTPNPIPGWVVTGRAGVFNPTSAHFVGGIVPDGNQTAFLNKDAKITQVLSAALGTNKTYTLQVDVGDRLDVSFPKYKIELGVMLNNQFLALASDSAGLPDNGKFTARTVTYTTLETNPYLGKPLAISLWSSEIQVNFDNVHLENQNNTPEPATLILLGGGLLFIAGYCKHRRRNK